MNEGLPASQLEKGSSKKNRIIKIRFRVIEFIFNKTSAAVKP
jgi:hypothetical protein